MITSYKTLVDVLSITSYKTLVDVLSITSYKTLVDVLSITSYKTLVDVLSILFRALALHNNHHPRRRILENGGLQLTGIWHRTTEYI